MDHVITQHGVATRFVGSYGKMYGDCFDRNAFYEQAFLDDIRALDRRGTYLDVGSNVGNHALFFARLCGAERVYAFEPLPRYAARIEQNVAANAMEGVVRVMPFGLADVTGHREIELNGGRHPIETRRLDDLGDLAGVVSVMKIDVEGMEEEVLRGGLARIGRDRPVIFAEANDDAQHAAVAAVLGASGYAASGRCWNASPTYEFVARW